MDITTQKLMMGASAGGGGDSYYIQLFNGAPWRGTNGAFQPIPNSDETYVYFQINPTNVLTIRLDENGDPIWSTYCSNKEQTVYDSAVDSLGNSYTVGRQSDSSSGIGYVHQILASGANGWSHTYGGNNGTQIMYGVCVNSTDQVIVQGQRNNAGSYYRAQRMSFSNTDGSVYSVGPMVSDPTGNNQGVANIVIDSNDNTYSAFERRDQFSSLDVPCLIKIDAYPYTTIPWVSVIKGDARTYRCKACISPNDVIYLSFTIDTGYAGQYTCIGKYDVNGNVAWTTSYSVSDSEGMNFKETCTDSEDNCYVLCQKSSGAPNYKSQSIIVKTDSTGAYVWSRKFAFDEALLGEAYPSNIQCDNNDNLIFVSYAIKDGIKQAFLAKLNPDGSGTGTYSGAGGTFEYSDYPVNQNSHNAGTASTADNNSFGGETSGLSAVSLSVASLTTTSTKINM